MERNDVSRLLESARDGDKTAFDSLIAIVYHELRHIAASLMRGQINGRTLQPTAVVNEAWMRLSASDGVWENKAHFFGAAARAMRQVLTEEARRRSSQKRAGHVKRVTFQDLVIGAEEPTVDMLALDEALSALGEVDERFTRLIELRYFAGCNLDEVAELTGRSVATVKRDWTYARAWLFERLQNVSTSP
ncbi:MAG TPA: sigma-70 family RNA polymerase sigma factor [Bryobacteraceae bacterium]|nr:sigma-70 family RNA polymerase sigma factor [Bryobacteraceae bacterium]